MPVGVCFFECTIAPLSKSVPLPATGTDRTFNVPPSPAKTTRRSAAAFRTTSAGAKAIAGRLGVRYLVEGSVRRADIRLRVSAQLIDAPQDVHCWAGSYDNTIEDVFSIQEQIPRKIVAALKLRLPANEERGLSERAINSIPAYELSCARHEM
jgi:hypothetical protein